MVHEIKERIKQHEGFRDKVYKDSLGKRTIGYGHLCVEDFWNDDQKYLESFLNDIFEKDFKTACDNAMVLIGDKPISANATQVIIEMVFQLGIGGVSKFKKMWEALKKEDYYTASIEMLDSRWHKQTPRRSEELARLMWSE